MVPKGLAIFEYANVAIQLIPDGQDINLNPLWEVGGVSRAQWCIVKIRENAEFLYHRFEASCCLFDIGVGPMSLPMTLLRCPCKDLACNMNGGEIKSHV